MCILASMSAIKIHPWALSAERLGVRFLKINVYNVPEINWPVGRVVMRSSLEREV